jgi:hypothetical protein
MEHKPPLTKPPPTCPRCGEAMKLHRTIPSFGLQPALQIFICFQCLETDTEILEDK